jgi:hypothetical protein
LVFFFFDVMFVFCSSVSSVVFTKKKKILIKVVIEEMASPTRTTEKAKWMSKKFVRFKIMGGYIIYKR